MAYLFELHYHTPQTSPCGRVLPARSLPKYQKAGYAGVVVTDHYFKQILDRYGDIPWPEKAQRWLAGYRAAKESAPQGLQVLLGMELRFAGSENDYLVYGLDEEFVITHPALYEMGLEGFSKFAREQELFFAQAHPFRRVCSPAPAGLLDGLEVYNGNLRWNSHLAKARKYAEDNGLVMLSGSDFHEWEDLCRGGAILEQYPKDSRELATILRRGGVVELRQTPQPGFKKRMKNRLHMR